MGTDHCSFETKRRSSVKKAVEKRDAITECVRGEVLWYMVKGGGGGTKVKGHQLEATGSSLLRLAHPPSRNPHIGKWAIKYSLFYCRVFLVLGKNCGRD